MEHTFSTGRRSGALAGSLAAAIGLLVSSLPGTSTAAELDAAAAATTGREVVGFFRFGEWTYLKTGRWDAPYFEIGGLVDHGLARAKLREGALELEDLNTRLDDGDKEVSFGSAAVVGESHLVVEFSVDKKVKSRLTDGWALQSLPRAIVTFGPDGGELPTPPGVRYEHSIEAPEGTACRYVDWRRDAGVKNEKCSVTWARQGFVRTRELHKCMPHFYDYREIACRRGGAKPSRFLSCHGLRVTDRTTGVSTVFLRSARLDLRTEGWLRAQGEYRILKALGSNRVSAAWLSGDKVWVGTFDAGLCRIDLATEEVERPAGARSIPKGVSTLFERGGKLYVGTFGRGLYVIDIARGRAARVTGIPGERIARLVPFGDELWVGTDEGVAVVMVDEERATPAVGARHAVPLQGVAEARAIIEAAKAGDAEGLRRLLGKTPDSVNALDEEGRSALVIAAAGGHREAVEALLAAGADPGARGGRRRRTALHVAAMNGHAGAVDALLSHDERTGARPGARENARRAGPARSPGTDGTPLHLAAAGGHDKVVKLLIERGADVNARPRMGLTPLHAAARAGKASVVRILLDADAAVNDRCGQKNGMTPLHLAAREGHAEAVRALVAGGADIEARAHAGTALHLAAEGGRLEAAKALLDGGAEVNAPGSQGATPLHRAARHGHTGLVRLLIERGADTGAKEGSRETALVWAARNSQDAVTELLASPSPVHEAAKAGDIEKVKALVEADPSLADARAATVWGEKEDERWTPLHFAAKYGRAEVVEFLVSRKVDVNARVRTGLKPGVSVYTPLFLAVSGKHRDVTRVLLENGADPNARKDEGGPYFRREGGETPLFWVGDDLESARLLLDHGANPNARLRRGGTPLHGAASGKRKEMVGLLLSRGASTLEHTTDGSFPVHWAARQKDNMEVISLLLDRMPDINVRDHYFRVTLLHWAARERAVPLEFAKLVVERGADLNATSKRGGGTPLHSAAVNHHTEMVRFLISKGADVNARDEDGRTPLGCALQKNAREIVSLLRRSGGVE